MQTARLRRAILAAYQKLTGAHFCIPGPGKAGEHRRKRLAGRFDRAVTLTVEIPEGVRDECRYAILALFLPTAERDKPTSRVDRQIDFSQYEGMEPVYTEYNLGRQTRSFTLPGKTGIASVCSLTMACSP